MTRDEILQYLYDLNFIDGYTRQLANGSDWRIIDDILQEIWLQLCEVSNEKWQALLDQGTRKDKFKALRGYVSGLIYRNVKSVNSRVYSRLKRHTKKEVLTDTGIITEEMGGFD